MINPDNIMLLINVQRTSASLINNEIFPIRNLIKPINLFSHILYLHTCVFLYSEIKI